MERFNQSTTGALEPHAGGQVRRFAFLIEQTLGHATYYANLRAGIEADNSVAAIWYPIAYPLQEDTGKTSAAYPQSWLAAGLTHVRRHIRHAVARTLVAHEYDAWLAWASVRARATC